MYCTSPAGDVVEGFGRSTYTKSCRPLVRPADGLVLPFCGNRAEGEAFDSWAVSADFTCRWAGTRKELCMNAAQRMNALQWKGLIRDYGDTANKWPLNN